MIFRRCFYEILGNRLLALPERTVSKERQGMSMAKVIREFGVATCSFVEPVRPEDPEWNLWRKAYLCEIGWLNLCESQRIFPGKQFLYFFGGSESEEDWHLKTSYGVLEQDGNRIVFITSNTRYEFVLLGEQEG